MRKGMRTPCYPRIWWAQGRASDVMCLWAEMTSRFVSPDEWDKRSRSIDWEVIAREAIGVCLLDQQYSICTTMWSKSVQCPRLCNEQREKMTRTNCVRKHESSLNFSIEHTSVTKSDIDRCPAHGEATIPHAENDEKQRDYWTEP